MSPGLHSVGPCHRWAENADCDITDTTTELYASLTGELARRIAALPPVVFVRSVPSVRAIGHINRPLRGGTVFSDDMRGDIETLLDEFHVAAFPDESKRPPRSMKVVVIESWLAVPSKPTKPRGVKRETSQADTQAPDQRKTRKTGQARSATAPAPEDVKEPVMDHRSMIVFTTDFLMEMCRAMEPTAVRPASRRLPILACLWGDRTFRVSWGF